MPQCKECFKPIVTDGLCRPCREESQDSADITQEYPNGKGWVPIFSSGEDGQWVPTDEVEIDVDIELDRECGNNLTAEQEVELIKRQWRP